MTDVLFITSYFPPETGAASNRISHMADGLQKKGYNVSVITPLPNYPTGKIFKDYKGKFKRTSTENNITIHRLWVYASNSRNKALRLLAMLSYSFSLMWFFTFNTMPKTVIVQSPPLLVAFTSMLFLKRNNRKLILNVSDLWPIAGLELGVFKKNFSYKLLEKIERFNYKRADLVLGQSDEILTHVKSIAPSKDTFLYRNYPDFVPPRYQELKPVEDNIKMVYAGLLGIAQGILKLCENLDYSKMEFHIYGAGPEKEKLEAFIKTNPKLPIFYHGEVSRKELHSVLTQYDITIIPLLNRIYGSVPSKIFEYAHIGLPMVYFGGGEGEKLIQENGLGWVAEVRNFDALNMVISNINNKDLRHLKKQQIIKTAQKEFNFNCQLDNLISIL